MSAIFSFSPVPTKYKVIMLAGQSNASGYGFYKQDVSDPTNPRIMQLPSGTTGPTILAIDPLRCPGVEVFPGDDSQQPIGFCTEFCRHYLTTIPSDFGVLIVPAADPGTGLVGGPWASGSPGGSLYEAAITQVGRAVAMNAGNTFEGILWHQGETDATNGVTPSDYQTGLDALIDGFRARISGASDSWFILGELVPLNWTDSNGLAYQAAIAGAASRKTRCAYWSSNSTTLNLHYNAVDQITNGVSAFNAGHAAGFF